VPVILVGFYLKTSNFSTFSKNTQVSNFIKMRLVGAEFLRADRETDVKNLIFSFRNFGNASTKDFGAGETKDSDSTLY